MSTGTNETERQDQKQMVGWVSPAWLLRELKQLALDNSTTVSAILDEFAIEGFKMHGRPEVSAKLAATVRKKPGRPPRSGRI